MTNFYERAQLTVFAVGITILFGWLLKNRLGINSLKDCKIRRNRMPIHFPLIFFFVWVSVGSLIFNLLDNFFENESLQIYLARTVISLLFLIIGLFFAKFYFVGGLAGFGIRLKKLPSDILYASLNIIGIWPVIVFGISVVIYTGKLIYGSDFEFDPHQSLVTIKDCNSLLKLTIMLLMITVITPAFEEVLFRGFMQSMLVSRLGQTWLAVALTSGLFTILHQPMHWLAIFPLSLCLGYSYEKSSSIIRPILMHIIFNTFNTVSILYLQN